MLETSSDETLLGLTAAHDEAALRLLYGRYSRAVYSLARRILRDESDAEEVVQDVFVKVWQRAGEYSAGRGAASTWLLSIAHHATIDTVRRRNVRATVPVEAPELEAAPDPRDLAEVAVEKVGVARALGALGAAERHLVEAAYYEGLTHSQLAKRTGLPLGTVKTRLRTALLRLRQELKEW